MKLIGQLAVLLLIAAGIGRYWSHRPVQAAVNDALEDYIEEHADTYVPVHSGVVSRSSVRQYVTGYGRPIGDRFIEFQIPPADLGRVKAGQTVIVDGIGEGEVSLVKPDGTAEITAPAANQPGTRFLQVRIRVDEHANALTVPARSIHTDTMDRTFIGVIKTDGRWAFLLPVRVGLQDGDTVEVSADGLTAGQMIVTDGAYALLPNTRLHPLKD